MPPNNATTLSGVGSALAGNVAANTQTNGSIATLSLLFAPGDRPTAQAVRTAIETPAESPAPNSVAARVSFTPESDDGWLELLASGLTFDLSGLAPASSKRVARSDHRFGLPGELDETALDALLLMPGHHIAGAGAMLPVIRIMVGLAARLARSLPVKGVCWHPAGSCMEPGYFARVVDAWLAGGAFPSLGLAAFVPRGDGGLRSVGLDFFIGQELDVAARAGESRVDTTRLAMRIADQLVASGRLERTETFTGPDGEVLRAEPDRDRRLVRVLRGES